MTGDPEAFDKLMERVLNGETAVITASGKNVAVVVPIAEYDDMRSRLAVSTGEDPTDGGDR